MLSRIRTWWVLPLAALLVAGALVALTAQGPGQAYAQTVQTPTAMAPSTAATSRTVTVSGSGSSQIQPDIAVVDVGVQSDATTAAQALADNNTNMQAVLSALTKAGIANTDIRTTTVQLYPRYDNSGSSVAGQTPVNKLTGFTATNMVEVTVRKLDTLGAILDQVVTAGGNQIQSVSFDLSDQSTVMDQAREAAMKDAQHRAQQLATLANAKLGTVVSINENAQVPIPFAAPEARAAQGASVPISPGLQTVTDNVQVTWELLPQ